MNLPSPVPPIILGANGQRLAEVAGRVADGVNFRRRGSARARGDRPRSGRGAGRPAPEVASKDRSSRRGSTGSPTRQRLAGHGVSEVMIAWRAGLGLDRIDEAGRWL